MFGLPPLNGKKSWAWWLLNRLCSWYLWTDR